MFSDIIGDNIKYATEFSKVHIDGESKFSFLKHDVIEEDYVINKLSTARALHLKKGRYTLLTLPSVYEACEDKFDYYVNVLERALGKYITNDLKSVLVVGLGNRHMVADSLGAKVVGQIKVTGSITSGVSVYAIAPSVLGLTGIESSDIIAGVCKIIKPQLVIIIDSLCANDVTRLGSSFQISTNAFVPGSGVENARKKITQPNVISIGVPLVVYTKTFIFQAFKKYNVKYNDSDDFDGVVVTPNNVDLIVDSGAKLIAKAINKRIEKIEKL
ncbi:MAG: GPR endopeptidase [Clostridia bacterium]|nr:GPR endopeptidase [Clostridia bacterium]